jgi:hypothetical protein
MYAKDTLTVRGNGKIVRTKHIPASLDRKNLGSVGKEILLLQLLGHGYLKSMKKVLVNVRRRNKTKAKNINQRKYTIFSEKPIFSFSS